MPEIERSHEFPWSIRNWIFFETAPWVDTFRAWQKTAMDVVEESRLPRQIRPVCRVPEKLLSAAFQEGSLRSRVRTVLESGDRASRPFEDPDRPDHPHRSTNSDHLSWPRY